MQNGQSLEYHSAHVSSTSRCFTYSRAVSVSHGFASLIPLPLSASREDVRLCLFLLTHGLFWHFLRLGLDQAVRRPGCSDRWVQPLAPPYHQIIPTYFWNKNTRNATFARHKVFGVNFRLLFAVLVCSDHRQKGDDHRTFLHVLCQTFHFSVSAVTFWLQSVYRLFNGAHVDLRSH